jgi:hypothetical protein
VGCGGRFVVVQVLCKIIEGRTNTLVYPPVVTTASIHEFRMCLLMTSLNAELRIMVCDSYPL